MTENTVYLVSHEYEQWGRDEIKLIGVYATQADAEAAVDRLRDQPGFRDWPNGFSINPYELGRDGWTGGFSTVVPIHVRVVGAEEEALECVHAEWMPGDRFKIIEFESELQLEFEAGQTVRCEERTLEDVEGCLVAVERVTDRA